MKLVTRSAIVCLVQWLLAWSPTSLAEGWTSVGPFGTLLSNHDVISGQTNAVAIDPRGVNVIYLGASEGGVWKTRDGGVSWIPLTDTQLVRKLPSGRLKGTTSIGALAINPANPQTIYAGTGDPNVACCGLFGPSLGVFRSTDGGTTWVPMGADPNQAGCENGAVGQATVNRVLVIPGRRTVVLAGTDAGLYSYEERGSDCWIRLTNGLPVSGNAIDLVADPFQRNLYVAFRTIGIFKSNDFTGAQWTMLGGGFPAQGTFGRVALAFGGRTGVGFGQPLPLVYAGIDGLGKYRLFVTKDAGSTWTELPNPPSDGQLDFNNTIAVGPYSSDEIYLGQIAFWRATDGGRTGGLNSYKVDPPVTTNSWTPLSCCLSQPNPFRKGLDVHGDLHDIQFAPYGSFIPTPAQVAIVFVAGDGGIERGDIDSDGVVTWLPLTKGLAIGQAGTIGLAPEFPSISVGGYWHNGDIVSLFPPPDQLPITGGDGFQTRFDAAGLTVYYNCNAGFGGAICRATPPAPFNTTFGLETIWSNNASSKIWSDPHRPGQLLRLQGGKLFRATNAGTAAASALDTPAAWTPVDPGAAQTGNITTLAFRSRLLEEQPVYYVGTDTGQIWRGSPEVAWIKLCDCGASINAIAPELFANERIFAVTAGSSSPGRIKELTRQFSGAWETRDIDGTFVPDLDVAQVISVVVDPVVPRTVGTTIYVGTDQGVYRGRLEPPVIEPFAAAPAPGIPIFENWTWRHSPGVPNVWVMDLKVHQSLPGRDQSGIIRAGTYGRGIFELDRAIVAGPREKAPIILSVNAMQVGEDGAPPPLNVRIPVSAKEGKLERDTPFDLRLPEGAEITLEAPRVIRTRDAEMRFVGWAVPGRRGQTRARITLKVDEALRAIAYYEEERRIADPDAKPLRLTASASARLVCVQSFTHELRVNWAIHDGQRPAVVRLAITYPDRHVEHVELKHIEGMQRFPMTFPKGGRLIVNAVATDEGNARASAQSSVDLAPCPPR